MTHADYIARAEYFEMKAREYHHISDNVRSHIAIERAFLEATHYEQLAQVARLAAARKEAA